MNIIDWPLDAARAIRIVPANQAGCEDLQAVFSTRGPAAMLHGGTATPLPRGV